MSGGFAVASAPSLQRDLGAGLLGLNAALLAVPMLAGLLEAPILAWTDRARARRHLVVAAGLAGMALALLLGSVARGAAGLALAMAVYGPLSGVALGTAEAMLVDEAGDDAPRRLARWTFYAALGDVLAPALLALAAALGVPWRASFRAAGVVLALTALAATRAPVPAAGDGADAGDHEPVWASLRAALAHRRLLAWLLGAALCTLLDELLAVFAALWVSARFSPALAAPALVAFAAGGAAGAALLERALARWSPRALLAGASALCAAAYAAWLAAPSWPLALALFVVVGAAAAPLHPLAKAAAFAALPSRPGLVNGAGQAFLVVDLVAPVALAYVGERAGLRAALALLALQPLALLALALLPPRRPG